MSITVNIRDDVSVSELRTIAKSQPVVKTPHVGNSSPNNLFAAKCEFSIMWLDVTIPARDKNANPHLLIRNGNATPLSEREASLRKLTTHVRVEKSGHETHGFVPGEPIVVGHIRQMRRVFPNTQIVTGYEHYQRYGERTRAILEVATDALPQVWYRRVEENGEIHKFEKGQSTGVTGWIDIEKDIFLYPNTQGWILPNVFAILHDLVIQSWESNSNEVWMLSGPDMVRYIDGLVPELSVAYDAVRKRLGLTSKLQICLVPFTHFRFAVRFGHKESLDALLRELMSGHCSFEVLHELSKDCPDIWTKTERRNHFSQHDMGSPDDLYAPEELMSFSLKTVNELWLRLDPRMREKVA